MCNGRSRRCGIATFAQRALEGDWLVYHSRYLEWELWSNHCMAASVEMNGMEKAETWQNEEDSMKLGATQRHSPRSKSVN